MDSQVKEFGVTDKIAGTSAENADANASNTPSEKSCCSGKGHHHHHQHHHEKCCSHRIEGQSHYTPIPLSEMKKGMTGTVCCNPDKKTKVIGLNNGKRLIIFKNESYEPNMIVSMESTRYIIAKSIASQILVIQDCSKEPCSE